MGMIYTTLMIALLIVVVFLTAKVLKLHVNYHIMKFQIMEDEIRNNSRFNEINSILDSIEISECKKVVEHNPLLNYRNDLIKTLKFKKAKIKNVGKFQAWYSDKQGKIINVAEDTISIEQDENIYITDEGLYILKEHVTLIK